MVKQYIGNNNANYKVAEKSGWGLWWESWQMIGNGGNDTLVGGAEGDKIYGGADNDWLYGRDGNDYLYGDTGNDIIYGENHNDYIEGGSGNDYLYGGSGNDTIHGQDDHDYILGGMGNDYLSGGTGNDTIYGEANNDQLLGHTGNDRLVGDSGNDFIDGYNWNIGGVEYDTLTGGGDADTFALGRVATGISYLGNGYATITDFDWREGDKIQVYGRTGYSLGQGNFVGTAATDTVIYQNGDAIGIVQDTIDINLNTDFIFL
ncbi:MAG TPA: calcium-binding protein [Coleofasciculaceae cyanobacterium]